MNIYRQGDCMLVAIPEIPTDAVAVEPAKNGRLVLLEGEATGHFHQFMDAQDARLYRGTGGSRYLEVTKESALEHEEHSTVIVPAGKYLLPQQCEYTPKELVRVAD